MKTSILQYSLLAVCMAINSGGVFAAPNQSSAAATPIGQVAVVPGAAVVVTSPTPSPPANQKPNDRPIYPVNPIKPPVATPSPTPVSIKPPALIKPPVSIVPEPSGIGNPVPGHPDYSCRLFESNNQFVRFDLTYTGGGCVTLNSKRINLRLDVPNARDHDIPGTLQFADTLPQDKLCSNQTRSIKITYNDLPPPKDRTFIKLRLRKKHDIDIPLSACQKVPYVGKAVKPFPFEKFGSVHGDIAYRQLDRTNNSVSFALTYVPSQPGQCLQLNSKQINLRKDIRNHADKGWIAAALLLNPFVATIFTGTDEDVGGKLQSLDRGPTFILCPQQQRHFKITMDQTFAQECKPGRVASAVQLFLKVRVDDQHDRDVKNILPCFEESKTN